jgi:hypothetical protein
MIGGGHLEEDDRQRSWRTRMTGGALLEEGEEERRCCMQRRSTTGGTDGVARGGGQQLAVGTWRRTIVVCSWRMRTTDVALGGGGTLGGRGRLAACSWRRRRKTDSVVCRGGRRPATSATLRAKEDGSRIFSGA